MMKKVTQTLVKITQYRPYILNYAITSQNGIIHLGIWLYAQTLLISLCIWIMIHFLWENHFISFVGMGFGTWIFVKLQQLFIHLMHTENYAFMLILQTFVFFLLSLLLTLFVTYFIFNNEIQLEVFKIHPEKPYSHGAIKVLVYLWGLMNLLQQTFGLFWMILLSLIVIFFTLMYPSLFIYWNQDNLYHRILRNYEQYKQSNQRKK